MGLVIMEVIFFILINACAPSFDLHSTFSLAKNEAVFDVITCKPDHSILECKRRPSNRMECVLSVYRRIVGPLAWPKGYAAQCKYKDGVLNVRETKMKG